MFLHVFFSKFFSLNLQDEKFSNRGSKCFEYLRTLLFFYIFFSWQIRSLTSIRLRVMSICLFCLFVLAENDSSVLDKEQAAPKGGEMLHDFCTREIY